MHDIDTKLLRSFLSVSAELSFSKAANRVGCSQATMSQRIRQLEYILDATLFRREYHNVSLTSAGATLAPLAQSVLDKHDSLIGRMRNNQVTGSVRLGIAEDYVLPMLVELLKKVRHAYPGIELSIVSGLSKGLALQVDARSLDIAVVTMPLSRPSSLVLSKPRLRWVAHRAFQHSKETPWPIAFFPEGCAFRDVAIERLTESNIAYREALVSPSGQVIQSAVASGTAISIMADGTIPSDFAELPKTAELPALPQTFIKLIHRDHGLSEAGQTIKKLVVESF